VFDIWQHAPPSPKIQTLNGGFLLLPADNTVDVCYQQLMPASSYTVVCNRVRRRESLVCFRVSYIPNSLTPYYRDVHYSSLLVFCWHLVVSAYYTYTLHTYTVLESAESWVIRECVDVTPPICVWVSAYLFYSLCVNLNFQRVSCTHTYDCIIQ
jgi:hypothetical protein